MTAARVAVVGGGLAGITAALRLADAGAAVTLLEARPRLGGLTCSFRRGGLDVDNGQHVFLRCCTAYRALLDRLGVSHLTAMQPRLDVAVRRPDGVTARLRRDGLPAPLHLARSLASYRVLRPVDRARAVRGALALRRVDRADPRLDDVGFGAWLSAHGQNQATVDALWDMVGVATLNAHAGEASLAVAATVFQLGLLTDAAAADIGWSRVPLQRLHGDAALAALGAAGVDVRVRAKVRHLAAGPDGWRLWTDRDVLDVTAVVVATDATTAERLLPPAAVVQPPGWSRRLGTTPIVNVHVVFDRPVLDRPFLAGVGTAVQWVFDRTAASGLAATATAASFPAAQYVALSLSAADRLLGRTAADLTRELLPELRRLLPAARDAEVLDMFVTREPHATFRAAPGSGRSRPATVTRLPGLVLAGAWTATGWPATMEGAVRSGDAAAAAVLAAPVRRTVVAA